MAHRRVTHVLHAGTTCNLDNEGLALHHTLAVKLHIQSLVSSRLQELFTTPETMIAQTGFRCCCHNIPCRMIPSCPYTILTSLSLRTLSSWAGPVAPSHLVSHLCERTCSGLSPLCLILSLLLFNLGNLPWCLSAKNNSVDRTCCSHP